MINGKINAPKLTILALVINDLNPIKAIIIHIIANFFIIDASARFQTLPVSPKMLPYNVNLFFHYHIFLTMTEYDHAAPRYTILYDIALSKREKKFSVCRIWQEIFRNIGFCFVYIFTKFFHVIKYKFMVHTCLFKLVTLLLCLAGIF